MPVIHPDADEAPAANNDDSLADHHGPTEALDPYALTPAQARRLVDAYHASGAAAAADAADRVNAWLHGDYIAQHLLPDSMARLHAWWVDNQPEPGLPADSIGFSARLIYNRTAGTYQVHVRLGAVEALCPIEQAHDIGALLVEAATDAENHTAALAALLRRGWEPAQAFAVVDLMHHELGLSRAAEVAAWEAEAAQGGAIAAPPMIPDPPDDDPPALLFTIHARSA